jgi:hypothetical protein
MLQQYFTTTRAMELLFDLTFYWHSFHKQSLCSTQEHSRVEKHMLHPQSQTLQGLNANRITTVGIKDKQHVSSQ